MADIRINQLPDENSPVATEVVPIDGATTRKTTIQKLVDIGAPIASQAEAEAGVNATKRMTPLTTKQSIDEFAASAAQGALADTALQPVANRTALKAVDTTKITAVSLKEANREGTFIWTAGDYSSQVTADTQEGRYVKADAIAASSGAWVRSDGATKNLRWYGAVGDGVTDDTTAWEAFQAASGIPSVPAGEYLVNGATKTFLRGVIGNGEYDLVNYAWPEQVTDGGDKQRDALILNSRYIDVGEASLHYGPTLVTQTRIKIEVPDTATDFTNFKQTFGTHDELVLEGYYNFQDDGNHNYSCNSSATRNNMAGLMGSTAHIFYSYDAKETENGHIDGGAALVAAGTITEEEAETLYPDVMGATKTGTAYMQTTRRARYASKGYTLGLEIYSLNQSDDVDTDIPFLNNDATDFEAFDMSLKLTAGGAGAPITHAIGITSLNSKHGYYNGIVFGSTMCRINNDNQGPAGTVGINFAPWRTSNGFGETAVKYGEAYRHHRYVRENCKSRSSQHRFMYEPGDAGLSIECGDSSSYDTYIYFRRGVDTSKDGNYSGQVMRAEISASATTLSLKSNAGFVRLNPNDTASGIVYDASTVRFAASVAGTPRPFLGGADRLWNTVYSETPDINTSDARKKVGIQAIDDEALDAWGEVQYCKYQMLNAFELKGSGARLHTGVIAQRVVEAFENHGLDAYRYGLLCYDEWEATPEERTVNRVKVKEPVYEQVLFKEAWLNTQADPPVMVPAEYTDGDEIEPAVYEEHVTVVPGAPSGNSFGIRYEEALCMEAAYQRRRADRIEAQLASIVDRLAALEAA